MEKVPPPKKDEVFKEPLTEQEVARLREVTRGRTFEKRRDRAILEVLLATGLRRRALASLRVEDVDEARGLIRVRAAAMKGRCDHVVHLTDAALDAVGGYLSVRGNHPLSHRTDALWLGVRRRHGWRRNPADAGAPRDGGEAGSAHRAAPAPTQLRERGGSIRLVRPRVDVALRLG